MKNYLLSGILFFTLMVGCKKNDNNCNLSNEKLVGTYKLTAITYKPSGSSTHQDVYNTFLEPCQRDDLYIFNSNNSFNYVDAGNVCLPPGNDNSTWSLSGNTLIIDTDIFIVASFNCSTMVVTLTDPSAPDEVLTFTFIRQ